MLMKFRTYYIFLRKITVSFLKQLQNLLHTSFAFSCKDGDKDPTNNKTQSRRAHPCRTVVIFIIISNRRVGADIKGMAVLQAAITEK